MVQLGSHFHIEEFLWAQENDKNKGKVESAHLAINMVKTIIFTRITYDMERNMNKMLPINPTKRKWIWCVEDNVGHYKRDYHVKLRNNGFA